MPLPDKYPAIVKDDHFVELMALLKRRVPLLFSQRWDGVTGEGMANAMVRVFSELGRRIETMTGSILISEATGPIRGTGTLKITFDGPTVNSYTIKAGSVIARTLWGLEYVLAGDIVRTSGSPYGVEIGYPIRARWAGDFYNVPDNTIRAWAFDLTNANTLTWSPGTGAGGKNEWLALVNNGSIWISGSTRITDGRLGTLDLRGAGRGVPRIVGESDADYRPRVRMPSLDALTPNGVIRAVNSALGYDGAVMIEFWENGFAFGRGAFGRHPFSRKNHFIVLVPPGVDLATMQALVDQVRPRGVYARVFTKGD